MYRLSIRRAAAKVTARYAFVAFTDLSAAPRWINKHFRLQSKAICHSGNVVEEGDDLGGIVDGSIVEAVGAQHVQIRGRHLLLMMGEFDGVGTQSPVFLVHRSGTPIAHQRVDECVGGFAALKLVFDLGTEVVGVGLRSVAAV